MWLLGNHLDRYKKIFYQGEKKMKTTKWKTLLAASMAGFTLLSSAPLQAFATETQGTAAGLVMDDTANVINGLTNAHIGQMTMARHGPVGKVDIFSKESKRLLLQTMMNKFLTLPIGLHKHMQVVLMSFIIMHCGQILIGQKLLKLQDLHLCGRK